MYNTVIVCCIDNVVMVYDVNKDFKKLHNQKWSQSVHTSKYITTMKTYKQQVITVPLCDGKITTF